jgi:integrase
MHSRESIQLCHFQWSSIFGCSETQLGVPERETTIKVQYVSFAYIEKGFNPNAFVPDRIRPTRATLSPVAIKIVSNKQIKTLLSSIDGLPGSPLRHARVRALLLVLYCTGLRIGEAMRLRLSDVDLKRAYFMIKRSKGRSRLVPYGRDLANELRQWLHCRTRAGYVLTPETTLFERETGDPDSARNASRSLNTLFRLCGLKPKKGSGRQGLRTHDIRHAFAVHRLQRFYRAGVDPAPMLPWLSAYMGHVNLLGTQRYLKATPQTLVAASRRFRRSLTFDPARP